MKISVITVTWNCVGTVCHTLDSILSQNHNEIEKIIIDGASSDGTLEILRTYQDRLDLIISEPDSGIYDALNKGLRYASGDVVGFLHADDVYEDNSVLTRIADAFEDVSVDAIYGDLVYVSKEDLSNIVRYWKSGEYDDSSFGCGWMPPHPTLYIRKAVFDRLGLFNCKYDISADYDLILRFFSIAKIKTVYIPRILVRMRLGGKSNGKLKFLIKKSREDFDILKRHKIGGMLTLFKKNLFKIGQFFLH
jgi:glycosyltransferase involved in cell wall biosynthesis